MALTGAFATGLSGLDASAQNIDVIGNNIANVNTPAFKSTRALFTSQFPANYSLGSPPSADSGGTNPTQVGLGVRIAGTQTDYSNGGITATGVATHMAIEGGGFFVVNDGGDQRYTRDGQFLLNSKNQLVSATGALVQGFAVDDNFNVVPGVMDSIEIPIGSLTIAEATRNANFDGNLNASGDVSTGGSVHQTRAMFTTASLTGGTEATGAEDLTVIGNDLYISDGAGGSFLAIEGGTDTVITLDGIEKNGQAIASKAFAFTDAATAASLGADEFGSTIDDFVSFLDSYLGLDNTAISGEDLGGSVALVGGQIIVTGNEGTVQDLDIQTNSFIASNLGSGVAQPFVVSNTRDADGESARTTLVVYDSLGTPVGVDLAMVKQGNVPGGGTIWEWMAESNDTAATDRILGLGLMEFDANGLFVSTTNDAFSIVRDNGATTPLTITMNFSSELGSISALTDTVSLVTSTSQDGSPIGTLNGFSVGDEGGVITGTFTNGLTRAIGQMALASFTNDEGLVSLGNNLYTAGPNSGDATISAPGQFGTGRVVGSALEGSNVDLAGQFVDLISASTGFSAASRVITTADQLLQQLLLVGQ